MTKDQYNKLKETSKDPITLCYSIYKSKYRNNMDINMFQTFLTMWLLPKNSNLLSGSLKIINYYDKKFAQ